MQPKVKLVTYTPNPEHVIADMARLCYADDEEVSKLFKEDINSIDDVRMLKILVNMRHLSPLEHASWTFEIEGVSRALTHQLVRHRLASYSQRSQRYVEQKNFDFVIPHTIKEAGMENRYKEMMGVIGDFYEELTSGLEKNLGLRGEARNQDARYVLPNACETKIGISANAREFLHIFGERTCNRAQWEIRGVMHQMLELAYPTAPNLFCYAGPACVVDGKCHQGKKSCGKAEEVKRYFESFKTK
ncbi:MAG: FAD-dependent thymidylate synthase [archaeon]|nr:FAD-dependent thymidylate synthase [archaeon]